MKAVRYILDHARIFTLLVIVLPIVAGVYAYRTLPKEGEPEVEVPIAIVVTQYAGASPGEIESLVTNPIEEALTDLKQVREMRSSSLEGVSVVVVEFDVDADLDQSIMRVREKVNDARSDLPAEAEDPAVDEIVLSDLPIMIVSVVGDMDPIRLKRLAENMADEIELLPEVLSADVTGGLTREIQIYAEPERLDQYGLTILDLYAAVKAADVNIPGGMIDLDRRRFLLKTLTEIKSAEDYLETPLIQAGDRTVYLGDVAEVVDGHEEDLTYSRTNGRSSVSISIKKRTGANILESSDKVRAKVEELSKNFPAGVSLVVTAEQAKFIRQTFDIMNNSAITGFIIVIIVLYFAMGLRNSFIASLSIPLSIFLTFVLMKVFGLTNNNMVRFSLVLCIGMLVDNAIIIVENAYHHYQLGKDRVTAVLDGVSEIALPVISATLTTVAAFLPVLLMTGDIGEYMSYLPKTVTIALTSSLIVALIANPLVLARFMKRSIKEGQILGPEKDLARAKKLYVSTVSWALNHRSIVILLTILALLSAAAMVAPVNRIVGGIVENMVAEGKMPQEHKQTAQQAAVRALQAFGIGAIEVEMFPDVDFDFVYITIETPPGSDVGYTDSIARQVEKIVKDRVPEAQKIVSTVGYKGDSAFEVSVTVANEPNFAEVTVELLDGKEFARATHKEIQARVEPFLAEIPGAKIRFRPQAWGPPVSAPIVVRVTGHDLDELRRISDRVKRELTAIPGSVDIEDDFSDAPPELRVNINRREAANLCLNLDQVALTLRGVTAGLDVKDFRDELDVSKKYDLVVRYAPEARENFQMLDKVKIRAQTGALIPLTNVAYFSREPGVNTIRHDDRRRVVRVTADAEGRSPVEISKELTAKLDEYKLPDGYEFLYGGEFQETEESFASLKLAYLLAFLLIFTLLVAQFDSYFQPFAIMTALPLSVFGALIGLLVTGNNFSIMSFVGLVGLTGIVVNDAIVLVDCTNRVRDEGKPMFEAIVLAGQMRLRPILSTTITTIGGIFTLTITDELWEGLGVVIMFGIGFATVLTLVVVPVMYSIFDGLGHQFKAAFRGARFIEPPQGRAFFCARRRLAWLWIAIIAAVQAAVMVPGLSWLLPHVASIWRQTAVAAPTLTKLVIEAVVFGIQIGLTFALPMLALLIPTWFGLVFLMNRRSREGCYVDVRQDGLVVTTPSEKIVLSAHEIAGVGRSIAFGDLIVKADRRRIRIRGVVEGEGGTAKTPLLEWLAHPGPARNKIKASMDELRTAIEGMMKK